MCNTFFNYLIFILHAGLILFISITLWSADQRSIFIIYNANWRCFCNRVVLCHNHFVGYFYTTALLTYAYILLLKLVIQKEYTICRNFEKYVESFLHFISVQMSNLIVEILMLHRIGRKNIKLLYWSHNVTVPLYSIYPNSQKYIHKILCDHIDKLNCF